ncbi:hypothetical protein [Streptomyces sp. NPDC048516]|uniref:hypothetical protein n=1 Tax=Streptomyces sp. NPDC048516 TaxID=3365565 RepID=UPI00371CB6DC
MTTALQPLPTTPEQLIDLVINQPAGTDLHAQLSAQVGGRQARRILARTHGLIADRLWAEAA